MKPCKSCQEKEIDLTKESIVLSEEETNEVLKEVIGEVQSKVQQEVLKEVFEPKKSKARRWLEAIKNPSQKTIIRNQWAFSFGFALGTLGLAIFSIWNAWHARTIQSYLWAVLGVCGFGITYWQVKAIGSQMKLMNADFEGQMKALMGEPTKTDE